MKVKQGGIFSLEYELIGVNVLRVQASSVVNYLKTSYFAISMKPNQVCSQCKNEEYINNDGWKGECVRECQKEEVIHVF